MASTTARRWKWWPASRPTAPSGVPQRGRCNPPGPSLSRYMSLGTAPAARLVSYACDPPRERDRLCLVAFLLPSAASCRSSVALQNPDRFCCCTLRSNGACVLGLPSTKRQEQSVTVRFCCCTLQCRRPLHTETGTDGVLQVLLLYLVQSWLRYPVQLAANTFCIRREPSLH